jgi:hypothetical protein
VAAIPWLAPDHGIVEAIGGSRREDKKGAAAPDATPNPNLPPVPLAWISPSSPRLAIVVTAEPWAPHRRRRGHPRPQPPPPCPACSRRSAPSISARSRVRGLPHATNRLRPRPLPRRASDRIPLHRAFPEPDSHGDAPCELPRDAMHPRSPSPSLKLDAPWEPESSPAIVGLALTSVLPHMRHHARTTRSRPLFRTVPPALALAVVIEL